MRVRLGVAIAAILLTPISALAHDAGEAKYLGNEGVLVTRGDTKILFDAFYAESFGGRFTLVPTSMEAAMMEGRKPFDGIDALFISHIHADHFNSRKTIAYLRSHPNVRLYAGIDVVGSIQAADIPANDPLLQRVESINIAPGEPPARFSVNGLDIEAYSIPHGGVRVPNYAYRVTLDGKTTVMHLGDADTEDRDFVPYQQDFDRKKTDVAFVPFWFLEDESGKRVLEQRIRPAKTVGVHLTKGARGRAEEARKKGVADFFIEPGETRPLPHDH